MRPGFRSILALIGAIGVVSSCDAGPTGNADPIPGTLKAVLTSPNASDAAMLIKLDGVGVQNVSVVGEGRVLFARALSDSSTMVAIVGLVSSGQQFAFDVPDVGAVAAYRATVLDASDSTNALRTSLAGYSLRVQR